MKVTVTAAARVVPQHVRTLQAPHVQDLLVQANALKNEVQEPAEPDPTGDEGIR